MQYSRLLPLMLAVCALYTVSPYTDAYADIDPFEFQVYGYDTQGKGKLDPELLSSYIVVGHKEGDGGSSPTYASQGMMRYAIELEYAGSKFRFRGRFAEAGQLPVDLGWYAEVEWWSSAFNDDQVEAEFMATMQKNIGKWTFIVNAPDVDKVIIGDNHKEVFEISWRGEGSYQITERTRLGLQLYGSPGKINDVTPIGQQQHYVVPTLHTVLFNTVRSSLGLGFGLTEGSDLFFLKANFHFGGDLNERIYD